MTVNNSVNTGVGVADHSLGMSTDLCDGHTVILFLTVYQYGVMYSYDNISPTVQHYMHCTVTHVESGAHNHTIALHTLPQTQGLVNRAKKPHGSYTSALSHRYKGW